MVSVKGKLLLLLDPNLSGSFKGFLVKVTTHY